MHCVPKAINLLTLETALSLRCYRLISNCFLTYALSLVTQLSQDTISSSPQHPLGHSCFFALCFPKCMAALYYAVSHLREAIRLWKVA